MLRRGFRVASSLARSVAARQLAAAPAASAPVQHSLQTAVQELKCLGMVRAYSTVAAAPGSSSAISEEMQAELDHATGLEKEELLGEVEGKPRFDLSPPVGPFGTTEAPAMIESYFDERLVGCSGGIGEEEHDVVWFKLKKEVGHECSVCGQVFALKVVGAGGPPGGHH